MEKKNKTPTMNSSPMKGTKESTVNLDQLINETKSFLANWEWMKEVMEEKINYNCQIIDALDQKQGSGTPTKETEDKINKIEKATKQLLNFKIAGANVVIGYKKLNRGLFILLQQKEREVEGWKKLYEQAADDFWHAHEKAHHVTPEIITEFLNEQSRRLKKN